MSCPSTSCPPYITWYNAHWQLLAALPRELAEIVSDVAGMSPSEQRAFARAANKIKPGFGTAVLEAVRS